MHTWKQGWHTAIAESTTLTVRLNARLKKKLEKVACSTKWSKSFLAGEAIAAFVKLNEWQFKEIKAGLKEADAGDFASSGEVKRLFDKYAR